MPISPRPAAAFLQKQQRETAQKSQGKYSRILIEAANAARICIFLLRESPRPTSSPGAGHTDAVNSCRRGRRPARAPAPRQVPPCGRSRTLRPSGAPAAASWNLPGPWGSRRAPAAHRTWKEEIETNKRVTQERQVIFDKHVAAKDDKIAK